MKSSKEFYTVNGLRRGTNKVSLFRLHMLDGESSFLQSNLRRLKWNVSRTANELGISREWLSRRIKFHYLRELEEGRGEGKKV